MRAILSTGVSLILAVGVLAVTVTTAQAQTRLAEHSLSPYFLVEGGDGLEPFALEATRVTAHVDGVIADVTVEQRYRNGGDVPLNTRYIFPASTRAAVHGLQMRVGSRHVRAQIRERQQAALEFERAAQSGKTASLLEQERPNVFSMALANVMPGDQVVVELQYSELLVSDAGRYEFVYPTVVGPRYAAAAPEAVELSTKLGPYMREGDSPDSRFELAVELAGAVPLTQVQSTSHKLDVVYRSPSTARIGLAAGQGFAGNRDFVLQYRLTGEKIESGLLLHEGEQENHFLLMLQPPARVSSSTVPAREYLFVLDVSGSMHGFPLDTAKVLLQRLAAGMGPADSFNVLLFSGDSRLLNERSLRATPTNVQRALALVDDESGGGGTELQAALQRALTLPRSEHTSRSVIVVTDGYIAHERGAFELIEQNLGQTNVFAFGIGSSVNRYLIEGVARTGRGEPFIVTRPEEAAAAAEKFRKYIASPVLTDVHVSFQGFDAYEIEPSVQPDLFAERPIVVYGKWRGPKRGSITISGRNASGKLTRSLQLAEMGPTRRHDALPQLWARSRIARLSDFSSQADDAEAEITALGLQYSLLTPYTSFIAVLEQVRNPGGVAVNTAVPLPLPLGVSEIDEDCGAYAAGAEPELYWLLAAVLGAVAFAQMRRRSRAEPR